MTDKAIEEHYYKNKDTFEQLAKCVCVSELMLKLAVYGKKWTAWDWLLLLSETFKMQFGQPISLLEDSSGGSNLYNDMLETIDDSDLLDDVFTNKQVLLSLSYAVSSRLAYLDTAFSKKLFCILLAHVFKKFPELWMMSWMFAKHKDSRTKKWTKYHRLGQHLAGISREYSYTRPKECRQKFIETHLRPNLSVSD